MNHQAGDACRVRWLRSASKGTFNLEATRRTEDGLSFRGDSCKEAAGEAASGTFMARTLNTLLKLPSIRRLLLRSKMIYRMDGNFSQNQWTGWCLKCVWKSVVKKKKTLKSWCSSESEALLSRTTINFVCCFPRVGKHFLRFLFSMDTQTSLKTPIRLSGYEQCGSKWTCVCVLAEFDYGWKKWETFNVAPGWKFCFSIHKFSAGACSHRNLLFILESVRRA